MSDLQRLTDRVGEQLSRSVAIDDPQMRLQSYSPHYGAVDEQRLASILHRKANPEAIEWARRHGAQHATGWFRLPGNPEFGMLSRVGIPIRFRDLHLGYLWLIDAEESLTAEEIAVAERAADEAANILYRDGLLNNLQRARERELLRDLLDDDPAVRAQAVSGLAEDALMDIARPVRVIVLDTEEPADHDDRANAADLSLAHARRQLPIRRGLHLVRPDHAILVVAVDRDTRPVELAGRIKADYERGLQGAGADSGRVGIGTQVAHLADARLSYRQAQQATRIGRVLGLDSIVEWSELGIYRILAELPFQQISLDLLHPALGKLAERDEPGQLLHTLEVFLDLAGDIKATSEQLVIHRTTLYHRLAKIEEIGGVSLRKGTERLALHLGLKLGHLSGRYAKPHPAAGRQARTSS
ncbi:helix-turn-helix domain-containing protein [Sphaerisporangium sp. NPDC051017]|uniref:PucR family transcriptional regulator n=1 Tax=Sphaerisporangium sp. NPDC051017 TaxID=3154636 RepID=UPI003444838E